ncbi:ABC transporter permease subunit [Oscillospiraceae bacterium CM]|nr:ABC transporter permease subunit [Oscillospiraceae bacterium CM]
MNIYVFELKAQLKSFIIWTVSLLLVLLIFMSGLFPVFMDSKDAVIKAYNGFPPQFAAAFGIFVDQLFSYGGFFQFIYSYISVIGAIMASIFAIAAFSREKRSKCVDFLLTKPVTRDDIFGAKFLSGLTLLGVANILFVALSVLLYHSSNTGGDTWRVIWASCALFFTQLVFYAIGTLYAVLARKVRSVSGIATALGFAGFILTALNNMLHEDFLHYFAPLIYFEPYTVFANGGFEVKYAVTAAVVFAACVVFSFVKYRSADTPAL